MKIGIAIIIDITKINSLVIGTSVFPAIISFNIPGCINRTTSPCRLLNIRATHVTIRTIMHQGYSPYCTSRIHP